MRVHARLWSVAIVAVACGVLGLALPALAQALPSAPGIADLQSLSHPSDSLWYSNASPTFSWSYSGAAANSVAYLIDQSASTVPSTSLAVPATLGPQTSYPAGYGPVSVALADVNGDGDADLVVTNHLDDTVGVMLGKGDGTFGPQTTYDVGAGPEGVVVTDLNGDHYPDIVVANHDDHTVSVLLGNGDGTFQDQQTYAIGSQPRGSQWATSATALRTSSRSTMATTTSASSWATVTVRSRTRRPIRSAADRIGWRSRRWTTVTPTWW